MLARLARAALAFVALATLAGCPETTTVASDPCEHVGDPCRLPSGPMGVCSESLAVACPEPPCLACTSQH